jgi:hypothetical protein
MLKMKAWRFNVESWRVYRPVVADLQHIEHIDEDPDPQ